LAEALTEGAAMTFEVEQKFRVLDIEEFHRRLDEQGVALGAAQTQIDGYFNHPARDFARTDEALRIRSVGDRNFITYKGPKIDTITKTRREIELPLAIGGDAVERFGELLLALGFRPVGEVRKQRRDAILPIDGRAVEVAYDEVEGLGAFVELECMADEAEIATAKEAIAKLATRLGLKQNERRSYLELLLAARGVNA
jgi:adenylate cyclase class 2